MSKVTISDREGSCEYDTGDPASRKKAYRGMGRTTSMIFTKKR